jgi:hypothetical protein
MYSAYGRAERPGARHTIGMGWIPYDFVIGGIC